MEHILVVDDNLKLCLLLVGLFRLCGFRANGCHDAGAAVEVAVRDLPSLIVLDLIMPGVDGYQVLRELRADPRTAEVPVIVCSAVDDPEVRARALELGAKEFLTKGLMEFADLHRVVQRYVPPHRRDFSEQPPPAISGESRMPHAPD